MAIECTREGRIAIFTINLPEALNAMNVQGWRELSKGLIELRDDPELWVGIITGAGDKAFCAGANVKDIIPELKKKIDTTPSTMPWYDAVMGLNLYKPLIAALNGITFGGGLEIALMCDIRIASENARLGLPEVKLGLIPGWGGTQRLPRAVARCHASEMILLGEPIDANEAHRIGLVNKVVPHAQLMPTAIEMANAFCKRGQCAVRAAKQAMIRGFNMPLEDGLKLELSVLSDVLKTEDCNEGLTAFIEKRKPEFKGK